MIGIFLCWFCKHLKDDLVPLGCAAFPDGIPDNVFEMNHDHRKPHPDDNGVQFELNPSLTPKMLKLYKETFHPDETPDDRLDTKAHNFLRSLGATDEEAAKIIQEAKEP